MKALKVSLVATILAASVIAGAAQTKRVGAESGGGGEPGRSFTAGESDILDAIENAKLSLPFIFRELADKYTRDWPLFRNKTEDKEFSGLNKIFSHPKKDVLKLLTGQQVGFQILKDEYCYRIVDDKREKVSGRADEATDGICLSVKKILETKQVESEIQKRVTGLIVHEISHLFGTSEDEAYAIQAEVETLDISNVRQLADAVFRLRDAWDDVEEGYLNLQSKVQSSNISKCMAVSRMAAALSSVQGATQKVDSELAILGPKASVKLIAMRYKVAAMILACGGDEADEQVRFIFKLTDDRLKNEGMSIYDINATFLEAISGEKPGLTKQGTNISLCGTDCVYMKQEVIKIYDLNDESTVKVIEDWAQDLAVIRSAVQRLPKIGSFKNISASWGPSN